MPADALDNYVALLRGIDVGSNNLISMPALEDCFRALGYLDVCSYINTGNVIFRAHSGDPRELDGYIVVYASGQLVHVLMEHDLVDELRRSGTVERSRCW